MRVGLDVSPRAQTQAGTARVVDGLLGALSGRAELDIVPLGFGGGGRIATAVRDAVWYPFGIARAARKLDVLHCTTFRGPLRARVPVVVTVHDLALLRYPEAFRPWHRTTGRLALRRSVRAADAIVADPGRTERGRAGFFDGRPARRR